MSGSDYWLAPSPLTESRETLERTTSRVVNDQRVLLQNEGLIKRADDKLGSGCRIGETPLPVVPLDCKSMVKSWIAGLSYGSCL